MNKKVKSLLVRALTGKLKGKKYKQTKQWLRYKDKFCILGVICDLHRRFSKEGKNWVTGYNCKTYFDEDIELPQNVVNWAGLKNSNPKVKVGKEYENFINLNDDGLTFKEFAKLIKEQL